MGWNWESVGKGLWSGWEVWSRGTRLLWLGRGLDLAGPEGENGASVPARGCGKCWGSG